MLFCALFPGLAQAMPLAENPQLQARWLAMYGYNSAGKSEITNTDFFLAPNGQTSPQEEFEAFLHVLNTYTGTPQQQAVLCNFPARTTLVMENLPTYKNFQRPNCSTNPAAINPTGVESISLLFAGGYFESPASYFGHTLIKFNTGKNEFGSYFFDSSLNYGAKVTDNTANPMYVVNGLTGGYTASYQRNSQFLGTHSYTNKQMRDVWEYPLNLTPAQVRFVAEYSTELKRARFKYYFVNDNCAHRIAKVVEVATGRKLVRHGSWLLPVQVAQQFAEEGMSKIEIRHPSLTSKVRARYLALSKAEQKTLAHYLKSPLEMQQQQVQNLSNAALELALMEYEIRLSTFTTQNSDTEKLTTLNQHRALLLAQRLRRPPAPSPQAEITQKITESGATPTTAQRPGSVQIGASIRPGANALSLRFQAANNTLLSPPLVGQEASRFIMGAAEADLTSHNFKLREITAINIASLNTNPLPAENWHDGYSWSLRTGYNARNATCTSCGTLNVDGKIGKAIRFNQSLMAYSLIGGQLNHKSTQLNSIAMFTMENGALVNVGENTRLLLEANAEASPSRGNPAYTFRASAAHSLTPKSDLQLSVENNGEDSALLQRLTFYF